MYLYIRKFKYMKYICIYIYKYVFGCVCERVCFRW